MICFGEEQEQEIDERDSDKIFPSFRGIGYYVIKSSIFRRFVILFRAFLRYMSVKSQINPNLNNQLTHLGKDLEN